MYAADMDIDMDPSGSAKALGLTAIVKHRRIRGLSSPINDRDLGASPPAPFCPSTTIHHHSCPAPETQELALERANDENDKNLGHEQ